MTKLTVCSVYFSSDHLGFLKLNIDLLKKLNKSIEIRWFIVNNSGQENYSKTSKGLRIIKGESYPDNIPSYFRGSYHHGAALNKAIKNVRTRYALILDPDFYIITTGLLKSVIEYMRLQKLSFLGTPWHPKWYTKYRYFPAVHCLFIDLKSVDKNKINFLPGYNNKEITVKTHGFGKILFKGNLKPKSPLITLLQAITFIDRKIILQSKDTGYRIYKKFLGSRFECITPVFKKSDFLNPKYAVSSLNIFFETMLPENLCFLPKDSLSYTENGFKNYGLPDVAILGFEEFIWHNKPFGFHLRGMTRSNNNPNNEIKMVNKILNQLTKNNSYQQ